MPNQETFFKSRRDGQLSECKKKKIMLFGGNSDTKEQVSQHFAEIGQDQRSIEICCPQLYAQEIFQAIRKEKFDPYILKSDHFFKNIDPHLKNDDLWNDIREIIKTNDQFDLSEIYKYMNTKEWEIHPQLTTSESAIRYLEELREFYFKKPLEQRIELLMLEVIKKRTDITCWVVLDHKKESEEKITQGTNNTVSDFTLRCLYHEKGNLKGKLVFWREDHQVLAPWVNNPDLWKNCHKNTLSQLPEIHFSRRHNLLLYGLSPQRRDFWADHQDFSKEGGGLSIDAYNSLIVDMLERSQNENIGAKAMLLENWFNNIESKYKKWSFWPMYYQTSESREKFKLQNIYAAAVTNTKGKERSIKYSFDYLMTKRGCKIGLTSVEKQNTLILFLLDGVDLEKVVNKIKVSVYDITASELRYVCRNWSTLKEKVVFARGNQFIPAPWEEEPKVWKKVQFKNLPQKNTKQEKDAVNKSANEVNKLKELTKSAVCAATKQKKLCRGKNNLVKSNCKGVVHYR